MVLLKLLHGERALTEASFSVTKLASDVVTPIVKAAIVQSRQTVPLAARDGRNVKRLHFLVINTIVQFANILDQHPVLQMASPINAELPLQIVSA